MTVCTNYDRNVRNYDNRRHSCGWQVFACWHSPEGYCLHTPVWGRHRTENPSRLREYEQACASYARQQDLGDCLWGIRLRCWDDPTHRIERAYTPIWEHWLAAYDAAKRAWQEEDAYLHCYCIPNAYDTECEVR